MKPNNHHHTTESSEASQDLSLQHNQLARSTSGTSTETFDERYNLNFNHERDNGDPNERETLEDHPKRSTGRHPSIRATSTDDDHLAVPVPLQDDPQDDAPGEAENPYTDIDMDDDYEAEDA
jgi:hypothetical protein